MPLYIAAGFILSIGCSNQPLATKIKNMWRVYLFEFIVALVVSCLWVHLLDKHKNEKENDKEKEM
jgi:uncharacterized membrane protein